MSVRSRTMPALFTTASMPPKESTHVCTSSAARSSSATDPTTWTALPPAEAISTTTSRQQLLVRAVHDDLRALGGQGASERCGQGPANAPVTTMRLPSTSPTTGERRGTGTAQPLPSPRGHRDDRRSPAPGLGRSHDRAAAIGDDPGFRRRRVPTTCCTRSPSGGGPADGRRSGWKIGFTNRTLWPRYDVWQPMWAPVWDRTLHRAIDGHAVLDVTSLVQPRIETEVVFCLRDDLPATDDARTVLEHTAWVAAGFEIVQCHFEGWRFAAADCTAAFGLHGALVVGDPVMLDDRSVIASSTSSHARRRHPSAWRRRRRHGRVVGRPRQPRVARSRTSRAASTIRARPSSEGGSSPATRSRQARSRTRGPSRPARRGRPTTGELGIEGLTLTISN